MFLLTPFHREALGVAAKIKARPAETRGMGRVRISPLVPRFELRR